MIEQERSWLPQARRALLEVYRRDATSAWIEASGNSMRPLIGPGTWMLVEFGSVPRSLGEIVLFSAGELLVAHRVVAWRGEQEPPMLLSKGDTEPYYDPLLRPADVIGVVRALRNSPDGPATSVGCAGWSAATIALISSLHGSGATLGRSTAAILPDPLQGVLLRAIPALARGISRVLLAPWCWAVSR